MALHSFRCTALIRAASDKLLDIINGKIITVGAFGALMGKRCVMCIEKSFATSVLNKQNGTFLPKCEHQSFVLAARSDSHRQGLMSSKLFKQWEQQIKGLIRRVNYPN